MTPVRLEPAAPHFRVKQSTTEPMRSKKLQITDQNPALQGETQGTKSNTIL